MFAEGLQYFGTERALTSEGAEEAICLNHSEWGNGEVRNSFFRVDISAAVWQVTASRFDGPERYIEDFSRMRKVLL